MIDLAKRTEQVGIILAKNNIVKAPTCRVGLCMDISGSMQGFYQNGVVQDTVDRLLAVAMKFDDDGSMDMWTFNNSFTRLEPATEKSYGKYVKQEILNKSGVDKWGGTSYAPCFADVVDFYYGNNSSSLKIKASGLMGKLFGSKPQQATPSTTSSSDPAVCLFITDGACDDARQSAAMLAAASQHKIYWHMVGIGGSHNFKFLQEQADLLPNVGFINMNSLAMSDEELYNQMITEEFLDFVKSI